MNKKEHKYSIRKLSFGASSIMIASLFFVGANQANASETTTPNATPEPEAEATQQSEAASLPEETVSTQETPLHKATSPETEDTSSFDTQSPEATTTSKANTSSTETHTQETDTQDVESEQTESTPPEVEKTSTLQNSAESDNSAQKEEVAPSITEEAPHLDNSTSRETQETAQSNPTEPTAVDAPVQETVEKAPTSSESTTEASTQEAQSQQSSEARVDTETRLGDVQTETSKLESDVSKTDTEKTSAVEIPLTQSQQTETDKIPVQDKTEVSNEAKSEQALHQLTEVDSTEKVDVKAPKALGSNHTTTPSERDGSLPDDGLSTLKQAHVATTQSQTNTRDAEKLKEQPNQKAKQGFYKNQDPIILVHGFNGFTDDINPFFLSHYWGGNKLNIRNDLEENGYETHEASISAFGSNYDRAVEL